MSIFLNALNVLALTLMIKVVGRSAICRLRKTDEELNAELAPKWELRRVYAFCSSDRQAGAQKFRSSNDVELLLVDGTSSESS